MKMMTPYDNEDREAFLRRAAARVGARFKLAAWLHFAAPLLKKKYPGKKIWRQLKVEELTQDDLEKRLQSENNPFKEKAHDSREARRYDKETGGSGSEVEAESRRRHSSSTGASSQQAPREDNSDVKSGTSQVGQRTGEVE
jgi:hypothetical protein